MGRPVGRHKIECSRPKPILGTNIEFAASQTNFGLHKSICSRPKPILGTENQIFASQVNMASQTRGAHNR